MTKISIITVTFNSADTIEDTIKSIIDQNYKNIEYIIVDGGSTDGTLDIIKLYEKHISKWISENDSGLYNAMNKGIKLASGDLIGILNSDDIYASNDVLNEINKYYQIKKYDLIYGNIEFYDKNLKNKIRTWRTSKFKLGSFANGWHPPHPGLFVTKTCYQKFGVFNEKYRICSDFEFMLRVFEKNKCSNVFINKTIVRMRMGGKSTSSLKNIIDSNIQCLQAFKENNINASPFYLILRLYPKVLNLIKTKLSFYINKLQ